MPRMRPGRIRHDIADQTIPDPFSWAYADPSDRYRTIRTLTLPWLKPRESCELGLLGFRRYV